MKDFSYVRFIQEQAFSIDFLGPAAQQNFF